MVSQSSRNREKGQHRAPEAAQQAGVAHRSGHAADLCVSATIKVFCFFSSEKKAFP
jgi:hypothetical protein